MVPLIKAGAIVVWTVCLQPTAIPQSVHPCMTVEFHLAERKPGKGLRKAIVPRTNEKIYLCKEVIFTNKDIFDARAIEFYDLVSEKAGNRVEVAFTKDAAERMERITADNRGKTLVILVNDDVIAASTIWETIRDRVAINYPQMTKEQAERIAKSIKSKCIAHDANGQLL